ncbi:PAS domain-containing protein [Methylobacterium organophilum]|uniref:hybrid sensor histidine kinase/response regulator n=1 Tax=Methylobacterium organophilum TaxID=410 RepID=UPI001F1337D0|nr:PAS domain-containing sensor histidine kinase [Methylobacterium organophilum]UMY17863.1 PAS domain-containing protein [Methylobacterium organophilum]
MGALVRARDWAATPLGPMERWPQSLIGALRLLLNTRHPMLIWWGPDHIQFYNDAYAASLGPEKHPAALGTRAQDTWPEIWELIGPQIDQVLAGGAATWHQDQCMPVFRHGAQQPTWWTYGCSPIEDEAAPNGIGGVLVICRETTAEVIKQQESDERYRTLFDSIDSGFCIVEVKFDAAEYPIDYRVVEANPAFERQTGLIGARGRWLRTFAPNLEEHWYQTYGRVALTGEPARFEAGSEALGRWFEVYAFRTGDPQDRRVAILFDDVTPRRRAEQALRASEELGRRIIESSADCIKVISLDGHLEFMSEGGMCVMEVDDYGAIAGACWADFWQGDERGKVLAALETGRAGGIARFEGFACTMKGSPRWWDVAVTPINGPDGQPEKLLAVSRDVTRQHEAETRLRELNETLESRVASTIAERERAEEALRQSQKMEAVGQLTGGLAHDFNNLLAGISGSLELIGTRIAQGRVTEIDKYMRAAQGATKRAAALTHRLLAFSRRQTLAPKPTDTNHLVGGMLDLIQRTVGPGIRVDSVAAPGLWTTLVDTSQLENALLNLCINARDAMPEGGSIVIETRNRWIGGAAARQGELAEGPYMSLSVRDTGTGMTPEVMAKAFDPFFTTKPLGEGTGLGLSMIYGFAKQSGGQVWIRSEVGRGTTVTIDLPRFHGAAETETGGAEGAPVAPIGSGETVLIVDDEPTVRMLVSDVLQDLGYRAIEAADGVAGLKLLQTEARIDLLVTDVGMPGGMNGRQLADAARVGRPDLKVLFITGYAETTLLRDGRLEPGMSVLTKPFGVETLAARMREILAR